MQMFFNYFNETSQLSFKNCKFGQFVLNVIWTFIFAFYKKEKSMCNQKQ